MPTYNYAYTSGRSGYGGSCQYQAAYAYDFNVSTYGNVTAYSPSQMKAALN